MVDGLGEGAVDDAEIFGDLGGVGEEFADIDAADRCCRIW